MRCALLMSVVTGFVLLEVCGADTCVFAETKREKKGDITVVEFNLRPTDRSSINCRLMLPPREKWTGRFRGVGNVGAGGGLHAPWLAEFAARGEAAADCDLGTSGRQADANREAWIDFGSRATHLMTEHAKRLVTDFYGKPPHHSYFTGQSTGGNQALQEAQRYPEDYDGIVARVPALDRTGYQNALRILWHASHKDGRQVFRKEMYDAVRQAALDVCRDRDPAWCSGSFLANPSREPKDWQTVLDRAAVLCPALADADLRERWMRVFAAGFPLGGLLTDVNLNALFLLRWWNGGCSWGFSRPDEAERAAKAFAEMAPLVDAKDPDLSRFAARGGRLFMYSGMGDTLIPYGLITDYYNRCVEKTGRDKVRECVAYYELPGRGHTSDITVAGVFEVDRFDDLIVDWVEKGRHPGAVRASLVGSADKLLVPPYGTGGTIVREHHPGR